MECLAGGSSELGQLHWTPIPGLSVRVLLPVAISLPCQGTASWAEGEARARAPPKSIAYLQLPEHSRELRARVAWPAFCQQG